jgi:hypothetical protein
MNGISPWAAVAKKVLINYKSPGLFTKKCGCLEFDIISSGDSLWILAKSRKGEKYAFRTAFSANDIIEVLDLRENSDHVSVSVESVIGKFTVKIQFPETEDKPLHYTIMLKAGQPLLIPFWPRDIIGLSPNGLSTTKIHVSQVGTRSGLLYATTKRGSLFYLQNLTALNEYCQYTGTSAAAAVGGQWPEIGFSLPSTKEKPVPAGKEVVVSDAFVLLNNDQPRNEFDMTKQFLNLLAEGYVHLPKPPTEYQDWLGILQKNKKHLQFNSGCWSHVKGNSYLNAYVSDYETPSEIMVQLAVLLPMTDYSKWSHEQLPVAKTLLDGLENFYDKKAGTIVRWLPAQEEKLDGSEEHKKPRLMDSWYLHHPLVNLSRLAIERKNKKAKKLFLDSLEFAIKAAHKFNYKWPVFYNVDTLEVIKAETKPGMGGEKDVPGLYAHVMMQAWELTRNKRYLEEAKKAGISLKGKGFELFYQANNTAFAAGAMLRIWKETREEVYLDLSYLCLANVMKNVMLWECNYGYAKYYPTFFGVFPLNDAEYMAVYEEQEVFAAFHDYLKHAEGEEILPSVSMLLAEFIRYMMFRGVAYYPPELPAEMLAEKCKSGELDKNLWIPIEDLRDGWDQSGQIGQEVYGAGFAFGLAASHYFKIQGESFMMFIDYPIADFRKRGDSIRFSVKGSEKLSCRMVLLSLDRQSLPDFLVKGNLQNDVPSLEVKENKKKYREYPLNGNQKIEINWTYKGGKFKADKNKKFRKPNSKSIFVNK